jgi:hypothetical protein
MKYRGNLNKGMFATVAFVLVAAFALPGAAASRYRPARKERSVVACWVPVPEQ